MILEGLVEQKLSSASHQILNKYCGLIPGKRGVKKRWRMRTGLPKYPVDKNLPLSSDLESSKKN